MEYPADSNKVVVFYHDSCMDGFAAAALMYTRYPNAEYIAINYGRPNTFNVEGKTVFFVDFFPDTEWTTANWQKTDRCIVLDHHKDSADRAVHGNEFLREGDYIAFDMDHSGAGLAWNYLHPGEEMPPIVKLVELRDLWRLTPDMRKYHEYFATFLAKGEPSVIFPPFIKVMETKDQAGIDEITAKADVLVKARDQQIEWFMTKATWWYRGQTIKGPRGTVDTTIAVLNCPHIFISETASQIMEKNPRVDLVIGTSISGKGMGFSFRSRAGSGLASFAGKRFLGGGHADAAGGRSTELLTYDQIIAKVCE
ncbi:single-stranded-DNA-specific exonuclease [Serratia phage vB_SmaS-Totoro]|nr:single-stranded-DNA-specific exonuclease [Serratia phage vB_SmaS-Totoro]